MKNLFLWFWVLIDSYMIMSVIKNLYCVEVECEKFFKIVWIRRMEFELIY